MDKFKDKIVWITGASSGIGEALAYEFSKQGAVVILSSRDKQKLEKIRERCFNSHKHIVLSLDLEDNADYQHLVDFVIQKYSRIDFLLNCGAVSQKAISYNTQANVERKIMEVNFWGTVNLSKCVLHHMLEKTQCTIVVFSSVLGKVGISGRSSYSASKHALHGYFDSLRCDLKKQGYKNIHIKTICPGYIKTRISYNYLDEHGEMLNFMDKDHKNAMSPEAAAKKIITKLSTPKLEFLIGGKEILSVFMKRYFQEFFLKNSYKY